MVNNAAIPEEIIQTARWILLFWFGASSSR